MTNWTAESEAAFEAYVEALIGVIGHADRAEPLKDYCLGLLMPMERKSVEPLAAVTAPSRVSAKYQSLLHFVGQASWSDAAVIARVRDWVLPQIEQRGPIRAWFVDDTAFPRRVSTRWAWRGSIAASWASSQRLAHIPGVGPIGASLLVMKTPAPETFRSARHFAAWLGLTPKDHSTAGRSGSA